MACDRHVSIASLPDMAERTIVVNGFSKSYAMTGWRLGYACGPEPLIKVMTKIHQSCIMSAPTTSQYAAITALHQCDDQIEMMRDEYNRRRRYVVKALNEMGLTCFEPRGRVLCVPLHPVSGLTSRNSASSCCWKRRRLPSSPARLWCLRRGLCPHQLRVQRRPPADCHEAHPEFLKEHGWMRKENRRNPWQYRAVTVLAPAKLNLSLDVVGLLPNGYHDLDMIMQTIDLYERITLRRSNTLSLSLPGSPVAVNDKYRHQGGHCLFPVHGPFGGCGHHHS